jgi:hypothetical protein
MRDRPIRDFDFQAIEARAGDVITPRGSLSMKITVALGSLALAIPTMALGFSNRAAIEAQIAAQLASWNGRSVRTTFAYARRTVTLAEAEERADFHFSLPTGLPEDASLASIEEIDPSWYLVTYRRSHAHTLCFSIWKSAIGKPVRTMAAFFVTRGDKVKRSYRLQTYVWNVGDEHVILPADGLASNELDAMNRAMGRNAGTAP